MAGAAVVVAAGFTAVCVYALFILWRIGLLLNEGRRMMAGAGTLLPGGIFGRGPGPAGASPAGSGSAGVLSAIAAAGAFLARILPGFLRRRR